MDERRALLTAFVAAIEAHGCCIATDQGWDTACVDPAYSDTFIDEFLADTPLLAALDAVTAERDALRYRLEEVGRDLGEARQVQGELRQDQDALRTQAAALYDEARYARDVLYHQGFRYAGEITPYPDNPYRAALDDPAGGAGVGG